MWYVWIEVLQINELSTVIEMFEKIKLTGEIWASLQIRLADEFLRQSFSNNILSQQIEGYETIFHYTDFQGLIGILKNQSLFATNINFLNDTKEFNHGIELLESIFNSQITNEETEGIFNHLRSDVKTIYSLDRYVTCFSKNGDLLSQWRSYGNQGNGIAIGFEPREIENSLDEFVNGINIIYDESFQKSIIQEYIKISLDYFESNKELFDWSGFDYDFLVSRSILEFLEGVLAGFKHPSFLEEQEFRIEYNIDGSINKPHDKKLYFRNSNNLVIPYIKLFSKFAKSEVNEIDELDDFIKMKLGEMLPIKEIILGPSLDYEMNRLAIEMLLNKSGYKGIKIKPSKIPYRI